MGWNPALLEHVTKNLDHSSIGWFYTYVSLQQSFETQWQIYASPYFTPQTLHFPRKLY
jgi:hypothetical protein